MNSIQKGHATPDEQGVKKPTCDPKDELSQPKPFKKPVIFWQWMKFMKDQKACQNRVLFEQEIEFGKKFVESEYTLVNGFKNCVSEDKKLLNSNLAIPNYFDTALILETAITAGIQIDPLILKSAEQFLMSSMSPEKLFAYFIRHYKVLPDDIDTSSNVTLCLFTLKGNDIFIEHLATNFLNKVKMYDDKTVDVYFPIEYTPGHEKLIKWPVDKRVDVGVTANFLILLNTAKVEHISKLAGSYDMINSFVEEMLRNEFQNPRNKYYKNIDVVCFFISKLVLVSTYAKTRFGEKLTKVIKKRLLEKTDSSVSLSCRIMASINVGLLEDLESRKAIFKEADSLLEFQHPTDYYYEEAELYNANLRYYFGSKAMSTALAISALKRLQNYATGCKTE